LGILLPSSDREVRETVEISTQRWIAYRNGKHMCCRELPILRVGVVDWFTYQEHSQTSGETKKPWRMRRHQIPLPRKLGCRLRWVRSIAPAFASTITSETELAGGSVFRETGIAESGKLRMRRGNQCGKSAKTGKEFAAKMYKQNLNNLKTLGRAVENSIEGELPIS
jgi:hypothetical protein